MPITPKEKKRWLKRTHKKFYLSDDMQGLIFYLIFLFLVFGLCLVFIEYGMMLR